MIFELVNDYADALAAMPAEHPRRRMLELLEEAVRRDVHFIARHPTTLFQCLWNTCWWYDCPEATAHYEEPEGGWPTDDTAPPWAQPGPKLSELMTGWRTAKREEKGEFLWIRARRPPYVRLGEGAGVVLRNHTAVTCVAYSPDGRYLASGLRDGTVAVWDAKSHALLRNLVGHRGPVTCVAFSGNSQRLASSGGRADLTVRTWDPGTGEEHLCLHGHRASVRSVLFSPDDSMVASGSGQWSSEPGPPSDVLIWDASSGAQLRSFREDAFLHHDEAVRSLAYSADGKAIITASWNGILYLWRLARRLLFGEPIGGYFTRGRLTSVVVSSNGLYVAAASMADGVIQLLNGRTFRRLGQLRGHQDRVQSLCFSPDGRRLVSGSWDGTIRVWSVADRKVVRSWLSPESGVDWVAFSANGKEVASAYEHSAVIRLWNVEPHHDRLRLRGDRGVITCVDSSPDGSRMASGTEEGTVSVWDVGTGRAFASWEVDGNCQYVWFEKDGRRLRMRYYYHNSMDLGFKTWEVGSSHCLSTVAGTVHEPQCESVPDEDFVAFVDRAETTFGSWRGCAAWYPDRLDPVSPWPDRYGRAGFRIPHAAVRAWVGSVGRHVHIVTPEGTLDP